MNLRVPKKVENFLTSCEPFSFSRRTLFRGESMELSLHRGLVMFLAGVFTDVTVHLFNLDLNQGKTLLSGTPAVHRRQRAGTYSSQCHAKALEHSRAPYMPDCNPFVNVYRSITLPLSPRQLVLDCFLEPQQTFQSCISDSDTKTVPFDAHQVTRLCVETSKYYKEVGLPFFVFCNL